MTYGRLTSSYRRPADHRLNNIGTILWIIAITAVSAWIMLLYQETEDTRILSPLALNQQVYAAEYEQPEEASLSERDAMIAVIRKVWRRDWQTGVAIARCESGLRHTAINDRNANGTTDTGLFQVNSIHGIPQANLLDPYANAGYAYALFKEQGVQPWSSSNRCHHLLDEL